MKQPTFLRGVLCAIVLAMTGAATFAALTPVFGSLPALRAVITLLAGIYVVYLLRSSRERTGRVVAPTVWLAAAAFIWWLGPSTAVFAASHVLAIWMIRSLYHHSGMLGALGDLGLSALALAAAIWAAGSGSLFLTIWSFFLVQSLFVALIQTPGGSRSQPPEDGFTYARQTAEAALKRLATR